MSESPCRPNCKWCEKGECWSSGQIEKPADYVHPRKGKGKGKGKGKEQGKSGKMKMAMAIFEAMYGGSGGYKGASGGSPATNLKQELQTAARRAVKNGEIDNDEIKYEVNEIETHGPGRYQGAVFVNGAPIMGEPAASKKGAEQNAAKAALQEMFSGSAYGWEQGFDMSQMLMSMAPALAKGTKRKAELPQEMHVKMRLNEGVQLIAQRTLTKEDIVYSVEQVGEGPAAQYNGSVIILPTGKTYTGELQASKKAAENAAAEAAFEALSDQITPLAEERKANKAKKNKESLEALKERTQAKKLAQQAGKAEIADAKVGGALN